MKCESLSYDGNVIWNMRNVAPRSGALHWVMRVCVCVCVNSFGRFVCSGGLHPVFLKLPKIRARAHWLREVRCTEGILGRALWEGQKLDAQKNRSRFARMSKILLEK